MLLDVSAAGVPAHAREVLLLVGVEGLAPADAAAVCGISPDALRQRLHRARTLLARRMEATALAPARIPKEAVS